MESWLKQDIEQELLDLEKRRCYLLGLLASAEQTAPKYLGNPEYPSTQGISELDYESGITNTEPMANNLSDILEFLENPQPTFLGFETAVCWILEELLRGDTYPTVLITSLEKAHPTYRLSETVLQKAINFLDQQGILTCYSQQTGGRGRPRRMLSLNAEYRKEAEALAEAFESWPV